MKRVTSVLIIAFVVVALGQIALPGIAAAQDASGPATGFAMWVRFPVVSARHIAASITGNPEFVVGYRGEKYGLGAALGMLMARGGDDYSTLKGTVFQIGPAGWIDFWASEDGNTRGNVALSITLGRVSLSETYENSDFKDEASGTLMNFSVGLGGDHFLGRHFSVGMEGGFQGSFALDLKADEEFAEEYGISASGLYGMIRTMVVF